MLLRAEDWRWTGRYARFNPECGKNLKALFSFWYRTARDTMYGQANLQASYSIVCTYANQLMIIWIYSKLNHGFLQAAGTDLFSLCSFLLVLLDFVQGCQEKAKRVSCCRVKLPIMINDVIKPIMINDVINQIWKYNKHLLRPGLRGSYCWLAGCILQIFS